MAERKRTTIVGARDKTFRDDGITLENCQDCSVTGDRVTLIKCKNCKVSGDRCKLIRCKECIVTGDGCTMEESSMCVGSPGNSNTSITVRRGIAIQEAPVGGAITNVFGSEGFTTTIGRTRPVPRVVIPARTTGRTSFGEVSVGSIHAGRSAAAVDDKNVLIVNKHGTFINDIQVPEGTTFSEKKILFKGRASQRHEREAL
jgi:hypothetical protein